MDNTLVNNIVSNESFNIVSTNNIENNENLNIFSNENSNNLMRDPYQISNEQGIDIQYAEETLSDINDKVLENIQSVKGSFITVIIVTVLISMVFETIMVFFKNKIEENKDKKELSKNKKGLRITLASYFFFLIIYFFVVTFGVKIVPEITIGCMIASIFMSVGSTFFSWKKLFLSIFRKKNKK